MSDCNNSQVPAIIEEFRAGVTACLQSWSALRTAVESGWGGVDSHAKADYLRQYIYEQLDGSSYPPKGITQEELEDNLAVYMEEEFSIVLEDNSERQVASVIFRMYEGAHRGDNSFIRQVIAAAGSALAQTANYPVQIQSMEQDDDDDEDDNGMDTGETNAVAAPLVGTSLTASDYASQSLFGGAPKKKEPAVEKPIRQLGEEAAPEQPAINVDEDGFAPVVKRKGRKK